MPASVPLSVLARRHISAHRGGTGKVPRWDCNWPHLQQKPLFTLMLHSESSRKKALRMLHPGVPSAAPQPQTPWVVLLRVLASPVGAARRRGCQGWGRRLRRTAAILDGEARSGGREGSAQPRTRRQPARAQQHQPRNGLYPRVQDERVGLGGEPPRGGGSTFASTAVIRRLMGLVFKAYGINSLLDIPCGDCHWQNLIPGFNDTQRPTWAWTS